MLVGQVDHIEYRYQVSEQGLEHIEDFVFEHYYVGDDVLVGLLGNFDSFGLVGRFELGEPFDFVVE